MGITIDSTIQELRQDYDFSADAINTLLEHASIIVDKYEQRLKKSNAHFEMKDVMEAVYSTYIRLIADDCYKIKIAFCLGLIENEDYSQVLSEPDEKAVEELIYVEHGI